MVNKQRWKCWKCMSTSQWGFWHVRIGSLNCKFRPPHHHHSIFFLPSFLCLSFFILLSGKTVITPVPTCCIMVSAPPTEQWIKLYLQPLWSLDEGGRCLCGVIIITQWSCCHQPCHPIEKAWLCVGGFFSCPPTTYTPPPHKKNLPPHPQPFRCE